MHSQFITDQFQCSMMQYKDSVTLSSQARAHLNFEMGVNPEALSMTVMHGVMGQNTNTRMSPNTIIPDELSVRPLLACICMPIPQPLDLPLQLLLLRSSSLALS